MALFQDLQINVAETKDIFISTVRNKAGDLARSFMWGLMCHSQDLRSNPVDKRLKI